MSSQSALEPALLNIPVFAGHGTTAAYHPHRRQQLLRDASSPSTSFLLSSCHQAFTTELSSLSAPELAETGIDLADFPTPESLLLLPPECYLYNPIISGSALFLIHSIRYLAFVENHAKASQSLTPFSDILKYNRDHRVGILGFSSGILPACVAASSFTSLTFLARALEAYKLALWIGIRTHAYRERIRNSAQADIDPALPWGIVIVGLKKETLEKIMLDVSETCPSLCITAVTSDACVTISGHPSHLATFAAALPQGSVVNKTTLDTLYHSPAHATTLRDQVLDDITCRDIQFPAFADIQVPVRSTFTGDLLGKDTQSDDSLVKLVVDMLLVQPVNWDVTMQNVVAASAEQSVRMINIGPGAGLCRGMLRFFPEEMATICDLTPGLVSPQPKQEPIAIVGMAVHMPGARDITELWKVLETGINTVSEIPEHRFKVSDYNNPTSNKSRTMKAHTGNFIDGVDEFDNKFFKISPREAKSMDPQQRILLQTSYAALEDAGYVPGSTPSFQPDMFGTYVGVATHDYIQNLRNEIDVYYSTGTLKAFLSGRIAYAMQMSGPSVVVDTACSSSMVAVYQGCRALMNRDCNAALVGGVNTVSSPDMFIGLDRGHFLSPTGQCRAFDASADGYSRSEGCGMFVLKRMSDAMAENDNILGVIKGVEVNQSGKSHSITHPHAPTQAILFHKTLENAGITADRVNVVEAHGTGTQAGDPNELKSIRSVFAVKRSALNPLHITSIKANVGHLEAASGAAGLAKLLLMLQHKQIPRQISLKNLNPAIAPLHQDNTVIDTEQVPWMPSHEGMSRVAMLNNFGAAGSNTSLIVEEYVSSHQDRDAEGVPYVFGVSAKTEGALNDLRAKYVAWLENSNNDQVRFSDIAYTATARRQIFPFRLSVAAKDRTDLVSKLANAPVVQATEEAPRIVFVFSGQGCQYIGMGKELYESSPLFKRHVDECHAILVSAGFPGVLPILAPAAEQSGLEALDEFQAYQAAIFTLEYALAALWMSWGLQPIAVVGHSLGEYAAMVTAGVLTVKSALLIIANRVRLMVTRCAIQTTGMIAINLGPDAVAAALGSSDAFTGLSIACYNSPTDCVVSGPREKLKSLKSYLDSEIHCKSVILNVPFGYHSIAMEPLLEELTAFCKDRVIQAPQIPIISNVHGSVVYPGDASVFNAEYFARHCAEPVQFNKGINSLVSKADFNRIDAWIEIGPHTVTLPMLKSNAMLSQSSLLAGTLRKNQDAWTSLTSTLSQLYLSISTLNWRQVFSHTSASCVRLPSYPFAKTKFWVAFQESAEQAIAIEEVSVPPPAPEHLISEYTMLRKWAQHPEDVNSYTAIFETPISQLAHSIVGHSVGGMPLCPASVYIEQVLGGIDLAMKHLEISSDNHRPVLRKLEFAKPLVYNDSVNRTVVTEIVVEDGFGTFNVGSRIEPSTEVSVHVRGEYRMQTVAHLDTKFSRAGPLIARQMEAAVEERRGQFPEVFSTRTVYEVVFPRVVDYSKEYHTIRSLTVDSSGMEGKAVVRMPNGYDKGKYVVHPVFMDTLLHVAGFVANMHGGSNDAYICSEVGTVKVIPEQVDNNASYVVYCNNTWLPDEGVMLAEAYAIKQGEPTKIVAHIKGMHFRRVRLNSLKKSLSHAAGPVSASKPAYAASQPKSTVTRSSAAPTARGLSRAPSPAVPISKVRVQEPQNSPSRSVSSEQIVLEIMKIVADTCDVSTSGITPATDLVALGVDSLMSIEIFAKLQSSFSGFNLDAQALSVCESVNDIVREVSSKAPKVVASCVPSSSGSEKTVCESDDFDSQPVDVKEVLATVLGVSSHELEDEAELESMGLDSLTSIEALHALKEQYGLDLNSNFFNEYTTPNSVQSYVSSQLQTRTKPTKGIMPSNPPSPGTIDDEKTACEPFRLDSEQLDVKEVLANVLGVPSHELEDEAELESMGLDSLTSIEALHALKEQYGLHLTTNFFTSYTTLNAIKSYISSQLKIRANSSSSKVSGATLQRLSKLMRLDETPVLFQSSSSGNTLPLFLIHDGSGLVNYYERLSRMDRTVWGINNPHFLTAKPWESVTEMASAYCDLITSKSLGPILIGGWSFGGIAAYEIARQLEIRGVTVKGILLIDSPCPVDHVPLSDDLIDSVLSSAPSSDLTPLVAAQFRMSPRLLATYKAKNMTSENRVPALLLYSKEGYNPAGVRNVPKWIAERGTKQSRKAAVEGWELVFGAPIKVLDIPGNHFEAFHPANMNEISRRIAEGCEYLEKPDL